MKVNKNKIKNIIVKSFGYLTIILITATVLDYGIYKYVLWQLELSKKVLGVEYYEIPTVIVPRKVKAEEPSMKEWILNEVKKAGLDVEMVDCIIRNESGYNQYAINKNNNGTFDLGIFQINDIHKLPRAEAFDYKKATEWAIKKMKRDGFKAWYGARNCL